MHGTANRQVTSTLTPRRRPHGPDDFPGDWCAKNGDAPQRPADWAQRHVPILWHWHESCEGIDFTLRVTLFTGDGTNPLPKGASAYVAFCANSYDPITPQGDAPQPEILDTPYVGHGIYATVLRIPLAGLFEDDGQHLLPWQARTIAYKGSGPGPFAFYLGSATGSFDGPTTPILPATQPLDNFLTQGERIHNGHLRKHQAAPRSIGWDGWQNMPLVYHRRPHPSPCLPPPRLPPGSASHCPIRSLTHGDTEPLKMSHGRRGRRSPPPSF